MWRIRNTLQVYDLWTIESYWRDHFIYQYGSRTCTHMAHLSLNSIYASGLFDFVDIPTPTAESLEQKPIPMTISYLNILSPSIQLEKTYYTLYHWAPWILIIC
jgi:hypothetical protein